MLRGRGVREFATSIQTSRPRTNSNRIAEQDKTVTHSLLATPDNPKLQTPDPKPQTPTSSNMPRAPPAVPPRGAASPPRALRPSRAAGGCRPVCLYDRTRCRAIKPWRPPRPEPRRPALAAGDPPDVPAAGDGARRRPATSSSSPPLGGGRPSTAPAGAGACEGGRGRGRG